MYTVPVALRMFVDSTADSSWDALFADSVVLLIPIFVIFLFGQKYLMKGKEPADLLDDDAGNSCNAA